MLLNNMHKIKFNFQKSLSFFDLASYPPTGALPLVPAGGLPFLIPLLYVHPLVQFLNTPLL